MRVADHAIYHTIEGLCHSMSHGAAAAVVLDETSADASQRRSYSQTLMICCY